MKLLNGDILVSNEPDIDNLAILENTKGMILTLCSNFLENTLNELSVEKSFSNTDILLLLDDLMASLYGMIINQIKQLRNEVDSPPKELHCLSSTIENFKNKWDRELERIANKVVRSQTSEKMIFQTFNQIDKSEKSLVNSLFFALKKCLDL